MQKRMAWLLIGGLFVVLISVVYANLLGGKHESSIQSTDDALKGKALPIPPILQDQNPDPNEAEFQLTAEKGTTEFIKGQKTETYGYNGSYLGPVIRVKTGEKVSVKVKNELGESTTVHWHGLEVPGEADGGPHNGIEDGTIWNPTFTINQPAATLWFHPHLLHKTGEQVYKGLAGLFYIDDENSDRLTIPKDYGKNDFPLVIQDKRITDDGAAPYALGMPDVMHGFLGDTALVNGAIDPYLEVPRGNVRLRILNGSNARTYQLHVNANEEFTQIASDGGFLEKPVPMKELTLGPAERAEVIVDFSKYKQGQTVELRDGDVPLMRFVVKGGKKEDVDIPRALVEIPEIPVSQASGTRQFVFQGMGPSVNINGKQMDINRIDEVVPLGATEVWEISNEATGMGMMGGGGGMPHPFHAHGVQFQVLERNGAAPPANETGWKDTILVDPGETVKVIATFNQPGKFMYHCHILEHEDAGMMGQFLVK